MVIIMYLDKLEMQEFERLELAYFKATKKLSSINLESDILVKFYTHPLIRECKYRIIEMRTGIKDPCKDHDSLICSIVGHEYETLFEWKQGLLTLIMLPEKTGQDMTAMANILNQFAFTETDWWNIAYHCMDLINYPYAYPEIYQLCSSRVESLLIQS